MEKDSLTIIGSGCGIPNERFGPPCFALKIGNRTCLIDIGYDTLTKILCYKFSNMIKDVYITHTHPDHFWGVIPLLFYYKCLAKEIVVGSVNIYGHHRIKSFFDFVENYYVWFRRDPKINFYGIEEKKDYDLNNIKFTAFKTDHSEDSFAYSFSLADKKIVFTGDAEFSRGLANFAKDAYILVSDCSYIENGKGHMDIKNFEKLVSLSSPKRVILVHSYREEGYEKALKELKSRLGDVLVIGEDGLTIYL